MQYVEGIKVLNAAADQKAALLTSTKTGDTAHSLTAWHLRKLNRDSINVWRPSIAYDEDFRDKLSSTYRQKQSENEEGREVRKCNRKSQHPRVHLPSYLASARAEDRVGEKEEHTVDLGGCSSAHDG